MVLLFFRCPPVQYPGHTVPSFPKFIPHLDGSCCSHLPLLPDKSSSALK